MNEVPLPHSDSQIISPPSCWIIFWQICNPNPIPFVFNSYVAFKNPKSLNNLFWSSCLMPTPLSWTVTWRYPLALPYLILTLTGYLDLITYCNFSEIWSKVLKYLAFILMQPPRLVNLIAFETKFKITC